MIEEQEETGWKQHFPTYSFAKRDIALEEYKTAAKSLEAEERVFLNALSIAALAAAALGSLAVGSLKKLTDLFLGIVPAPLTLLVLLTLVCGFSWVGLRYFADRQKAIAYASRQVIILRRMLGLSYGTLQLVLPNWRVEGADEPHAVFLFPGWNTYVAYPYYVLAGISCVVLFFLLASLQSAVAESIPIGALVGWYGPVCISLGWALLLAAVYRRALLDTHERQSLLFIKMFARLLRLTLVHNYEYIISRATLACYEYQRLRVDLSTLKTLLVFIEDRQFFRHRGTSIRGIARALLGLVGMKRRSGGSTITQQLVRTLFIMQPTKLVRRKIIELLLARWFHKVVTKNNQIEMYIASVRFDRTVYGALAAMHYFWGAVVNKPSAAESFFLIERVSNVRSLLLAEKIIQTAKAAITMNVISLEDSRALVALYDDAVSKGKIVDRDDGLSKLKSAFLSS